jgi:hypothetical protein
MKTLYDLLGALPRDDAEDLRTAFRKAVKGAHPDINPGDPDAALKFRQIVRASEILSDDEQRAAYDHLLDLARLEQKSASKRGTAAAIKKLASGAMAGAGLAMLAVGGCLLLLQISAASGRAEIGRAWSQIAALASPWDVNSLKPSRAKDEAEIAPAEADAPSVVAPDANTSHASAGDVGAPDGVGVFADRFSGARGVAAFSNTLLSGAFADLDQPMQPDLRLSPAYIDRNVLFYRLQDFEGTFADMARPKRIEKPGPRAAAPRIAKTHRLEAWAKPFFRQRTAARDASREEAFPFTATR